MPEDSQTEEKQSSDPNEELLRQIREDFTYCREYWQENYEEAEKDMNFAACIPPADFKNDRGNRPCLWPDEISQYVKQSNNNLRQNKRSIKISPRSQEAKDQDAEHRQAYVRGIEYASKAQSIYTTGYESAVECGFGFWRVKLEVVGENGEQEPRLARIPNWATVYMDPDAREADRSDQNICFVTDTIRIKTFQERYPKAQKRNFTNDDYQVAPGWLHKDNIVIAEYWKRKNLGNDDSLKQFEVKQRITNGFEILEENKWIGSWIPIIPVIGEEKYVRTSGSSKLVVMSLIRRMRTPQQMLAYIASQEAEEFQMAPRSPFIVLDGTVQADEWQDAHRTPKAYLRWMMPENWNPAWGPPPAPNRIPFTPNAQAYELAYERWRRSCQAAAGITPLPTAAQRQNEKSGIAIERIQDQEAIGSFHFTDNYVRALDNTGRQLNELITKLSDLDSLPKQVAGKDQKDEDLILHVAPKKGEISQELPEGHQWFFAHRGAFDVTVSDGPNYKSQREEASSFADTLLETLPQIGLPPQITQQVLAIAVKLKNIGTFGDEIADLLSPPDPNNLSPQAKAVIAQLQAQLQQATMKIQELAAKIMGKTTEMQGKLALQEHDRVTRMAEADKDRLTKLAVAEIETKAQNVNERLTAFEDLMKQFHTQAHEIGQMIIQHQQAIEIAKQNAQQDSAQSAQDAAQASAQSSQDAAQAAQQQNSGEQT